MSDSFKNSEIYASWHNDAAIRLSSSSGGVADLIASTYLALGYKVVGAVYDYETGTVKHKIIERKEDLPAVRGSKYLMSQTKEAFSQLQPDQKYVVFGLPCQIYSLRKSLGDMGNDTILFVDIFCHGVPSTKLWEKYLDHVKVKKGISQINKVNFRDKSTGWHTYSMRIEGNGKTYLKNMNDDLFYNFYLSNLCLNKGCYTCAFRHEKIGSDIRLGDFWGPKFQDDQHGVSIVVVNTEAGRKMLDTLRPKFTIMPVTHEEMLQAQPVKKMAVPAQYEAVAADLKSDLPLQTLFSRYLRKAYIKRKILQALKSLFPKSLKRSIKKLLRH